MDKRKDEPLRWMPIKEYLLQKEMFESMTEEQIRKMGYYFWNNFSYEGYEEWKLKKENDR